MSANIASTYALSLLAGALDAVIARREQAAAQQAEQALVSDRLAYAFGAPVADEISLELLEPTEA